jgi:predicted transcriptional regulator YdeE
MNCPLAFGQMGEYKYKRELKGISEQWHKIVLPESVFGKIANDLTDIRIFGITAKNDTLEMPFLLRLTTELVSSKEIAFKTINSTRNEKGYYFTFEIPTSETINQIDLDFKQDNFDWRIKLEGSQNQNDWFTVIENYRILSIKNKIEDFQFTRLTIPSSKYRYLRLLVGSQEKAELTSASVSRQEISEANYQDYPIKNIDKKENKDTKQTEIDIELNMPVPVSFLSLEVKNSFDYYRPITIKYLTDSVKTEKGWRYNYRTLTSGTLNSIRKDGFKFSSTTVHKLKILIDNKDNQPLNIEGIQVKGYIHELSVQFTERANYFLAYGNENANKPNYDIERFPENIPKTLSALEFGEELKIERDIAPKKAPLFENKIWLWLIMGLIIFVLGGFSIKMMRKDN